MKKNIKIDEKINKNKLKKRNKKKPKKITTSSGSIKKLTREENPRKLKGKPTKNQAEYLKNQRRISNFMKSAEKRGYKFNKSAVKELIKMPNIITKKRLETIQNIKPRNLYKYSTYTTPTGEIVSGVQGRKLELAAAARKAKISRAEKVKENAIKDEIWTHYWTEIYPTGKDFNTWIRQTPYKVVQIKDEYRRLYYMWLHKMEDDDTYKQSFEKFLTKHFEEERKKKEPQAPEPQAPEPQAPEPQAPEPQAPEPQAPQPPTPAPPNELDIIFDLLRENIETLSSRIGNRIAWNDFITKLKQFFEDNIAKYGKIAVAKMIKNAYSMGLSFGTAEVYESDTFVSKSNEFLNYIGNNDLTQAYGNMTDSYQDI